MKKFIPVAVPRLIGNEKKYVNDCLDTTWISSKGKYVDAFEEAFSNYVGSDFALSCCNGTVALHLPLIAMGIKPGDEVIVPTFTYIATANAVKYCGATPVFVDCLPNTWNIDPADVRRKITEKTKCIIPVHIYGNPCDMDAIMGIAREHNLFVLEDAAECHGAEYNGKKLGTIGDAGIFSFFGNKIITTGEGGMVVTNNKEMANKMQILKGQGMDPNRRYWFNDVGYNYRMTNIEAAIGLGQLELISEHIRVRDEVVKIYLRELEAISDHIQIQEVDEKAFNVWWMFSIVLKDSTKITRDELIKKLESDGIETRPLFYPMHQMPPYYEEGAEYPVSDFVSSSGLNLPTHGDLTEEDICFICERVKYYLLNTI